MYRYTTPTIPITIEDIDFSEVRQFRVAIKNNETELLFLVDGDDPRVDAEHNTILLALTQEQTARLEAGSGGLQVRIVYNSGSVQATPIAAVSINDVYDEVIV